MPLFALCLGQILVPRVYCVIYPARKRTPLEVVDRRGIFFSKFRQSTPYGCNFDIANC